MTGDAVADAALLNLLLGLIIPPIVSFFRGRSTPMEIVGLIVFVAVLVFTAASMFLQDRFLADTDLHGRDLIKWFILNFANLFIVAITAYHGIWKTVGATVTDKLEAVGPSPGSPS